MHNWQKAEPYFTVIDRRYKLVIIVNGSRQRCDNG